MAGKEFATIIITINLALAFVIPLFFQTKFTPVINVATKESKQIQTLRDGMRQLFWYILVTTGIGIIYILLLDTRYMNRKLTFLFTLALLALTFYIMYGTYHFIYTISTITQEVTVSDAVTATDSVFVTFLHFPNETLYKYCNILKKSQNITIPLDEAFYSCNGVNKSVSVLKNENNECVKFVPLC